MELEIAFPSINRPSLVETTLKSLCNHLKGVNFLKSTIYVNIDSVPIIYGREKVVEVCKKYIGNVIVNQPNKPHWGKAFKWTLSQSKNEIFMFLNDDWLFVKDFNIIDVIKRLNQFEDVKQIGLNNNWLNVGKNNPDWFKKRKKYKNDERQMMRGNPSFFKNNFIKKILNDLNPEEPGCIIETQMTKKFGKNSILFTNEDIYFCEDLGEKWKKDYGIPPPMVHECSNYKLCVYCGSLNYKFKCSLCNSNEASVICNEECFKKHCLLFHNENEKPEMIECKNSYHERFYKNK